MRWTIAFLSLMALPMYSQSVTVQVGGKTVGTRGVIDFESGDGIIQMCRDDAGNNRVACRPSADSAVVATHSSLHNNENYCVSTAGTTQYTCAISHGGIISYNTGMTFIFVPDVSCTGSCTLNIGTLGPVAIKRSDGSTEPGGMLVAGQPQWLFYDGSVFRVMNGGGGTGGADARNRDAIARRFIASMESMTYASAISLEVTAGDLHKTITSQAVGNATINAATGGLPGQHMWIIIVNDTISGKTVSFGANLRSSGAVTGTPGKAATIQFVSDGTAWYEVGRTSNL